MKKSGASRLEELGLSALEARIYEVLVPNGGLPPQRVAETLGIPRSSIYPSIRALEEKGLVRLGAGYGARATAVPPEEALTGLVEQRRAQLETDERLARELVEDLARSRDASPRSGLPLVEVSESARALRQKHCSLLQGGATKTIDAMVPGPLHGNGGTNSSELECLRRGVRVRGLYEQAIVDHPSVGPYLPEWIAAGEEVRTFDGQLPTRMVLVDGSEALVHLGEGSNHLLTRDPGMAAALQVAFDAFWEQSEPVLHEVMDASKGAAG